MEERRIAKVERWENKGMDLILFLFLVLAFRKTGDTRMNR